MTNTNTVKIGVMPGRIEEFAIEEGTTVLQALEIAGLEVGEFEIKIDGSTASESDTITQGTNVILLTKKVKGNASVKIGVMPGRIEEYALEDGTTFEEAIEVAGLEVGEFEVKADGSTVTNMGDEIGSTNVILLTKKVKGN